MPEPLTIAGTAIAGARLGLQVCKEVKKVCQWLTGNLDSVGRFSRADSLPPGELVTRYYEYYIDNIQNQTELDEALASLQSTEKKTRWFTCKKRVKSRPIAVKLLFEGMPLIGKTRAVYEKVIKKLPDFIVFMPSHVELGKIKVSELKQPMPGKRGLILFLDDLDQFVARQDVDLRYLMQHLQDACPRLVVVATLRTGIETTDKVMSEKHERNLLLDFLKVNFRRINEEESRELARRTQGYPDEYDGTPGSVVLGLTEMQHRLEKLNRPFREICMALKLLYFAFLPVPEKELVKKVSDTVFHTGFGGDTVGWGDCIKKLRDNDLIRDLGKSITTPHSNYHRHVYGPDYDPAQDLPRLKDIFAEERDVPALHGLGTSFALLMGNYQEAITCCDKALEIDPKLAQVLYNKGVALDKLGRHEEEITCYDMALEIDPKLAQVWYNKGVVLEELGRCEEAITCYDKALGIDPKYAQAWGNKGAALGELGKYEEAITCCDKALEIDPSFLSAWHNKCVCLHKMGRTQEAEECKKGLKEILEKLKELLGEGGLNPPEAP